MRLPSPSMFVSIAALVVAASGTSYAVATIGSEDIRNGSILPADIKDNQLRSNDIADGGLLARDFREGQLPQGAQGAEGPQGPAGPAGADGTGRWVLINAAGQIEAQSGGFTLVAGYPTLPNTAVPPAPDNSLRANGNVYINAGEDLGDNAIVASIILQNTVDQDGGGMAGRTTGADANAEFSGEIAVSRCNTGAPTTPPSGRTNCAPSGAQNAQSFVVSPRLSDGSVTTDANRKAFYVIIA